MKKKFLIVLMVALFISIILWISGALPVIHKFNLELIKKIIALFN